VPKSSKKYPLEKLKIKWKIRCYT